MVVKILSVVWSKKMNVAEQFKFHLHLTIWLNVNLENGLTALWDITAGNDLNNITLQILKK